MYLNTFLFSFGLNPDDFVNEINEPITADDGSIVYNLRQKTDKKPCPDCGCIDSKVHGYYFTETYYVSNSSVKFIFRIKRVRFCCKVCGKTFSPEISGIERYSKVSAQIRNCIYNEFLKQKAFSIIAEDYNLSTTQIMNMFDERYPFVERSRLPEALCIDEIGFKTFDGNYACILYDHDKKSVIDVIINRQLNYLRTYFNHFSFKERAGVKYFISDLYEGYSTIKNEYFRDSIHIADMFHVVRLLREEVSRLRIQTYKQFTDEKSPERTFMKLHWNYFENRISANLARKPYRIMKEKCTVTTWHMMQRCLSLNMKFWDAYACLQDFYDYGKCSSYEQALLHIQKVVNQLKRANDEGLSRVGSTFYKWRYEIANTITCKTVDGKRFSNGPAEGINSAIKTLVKDANGYKNFERFRKRVLVILRKKKGLIP